MPKIHGDLEYQASTRAVLSGTGTAALPGITFSGDLNTGIYRPSADQLGFSTAGLERLVINDEGALVITDVPITPGTTTSKLYADGGNLYWNGTQLDVATSVSFPILAPDGTNSAPSYSFTNSTGTGLYSDATDQVSITAGGTQILGATATGITVYNTLTMNAGQVRALDSLTASTPAYSFGTDTNTGLFSAAANNIGISLGGFESFSFEKPDELNSSVGTFRLYEAVANGSNYIGLKVPLSITTTLTYTLPPQPSTAALVLSSSTGGTMSWVTRLQNIVEDTTPQLGGDLDVQANAINTSVVNGDIALTPNGNGNLLLDGLSWPNADGTANYAIVTDGSGTLSFASVGTGAEIAFFEYTAGAGDTTFSGADDNANTLAYTVGLVYVYKNGVLLQDTEDYTATTGSTVVLTSGASLNDVIQITAFSTFIGSGGTASDYTYTATAGQTSFSGADDNTETLGYNPGDLLVYLNGALLINGTDYTATTGTSVVLTVAASVGNILQVYEWGSFNISAQSDILNQFIYTASVAQTTFTGADDNANTLAYSSGDQKVYLNGALLEQGTDYTASNGTSIVLISAAALNDVLQITAFGTFSVANHYTKGEMDAKYNKFSIQFTLAVGANDTYTMQQSAQFGFTIDKAYYQTNAGTITGNVQIGGVSVTGMSALSFTSSEANSTSSTNKLVAVGDKVTLVTASASGATMVSIILHCTRT